MLPLATRALRNLTTATAVPAIAAAAVLVSSAARADVVDTPGVAVPTPKGTLEIGFGAGATRGHGEIAPGTDTHGAADDGYAGFFEIGFRAHPRFMVGAYAGAAQYVRGGLIEERLTTRSFQAGAQAQLHVFPYDRVDPWIGLGAGWHGLFLDPKIAPNESLHGLDLVRARVGVDVRIDPALALGPYVGLDVTTFLRRSVDGQDGRGIGFGDAIATFLSVGVAGRIDVIDVWLGPPPPKGFAAGPKRAVASR